MSFLGSWKPVIDLTRLFELPENFHWCFWSSVFSCYPGIRNGVCLYKVVVRFISLSGIWKLKPLGGTPPPSVIQSKLEYLASFYDLGTSGFLKWCFTWRQIKACRNLWKSWTEAWFFGFFSFIFCFCFVFFYHGDCWVLTVHWNSEFLCAGVWLWAPKENLLARGLFVRGRWKYLQIPCYILTILKIFLSQSSFGSY